MLWRHGFTCTHLRTVLDHIELVSVFVFIRLHEGVVQFCYAPEFYLLPESIETMSA